MRQKQSAPGGGGANSHRQRRPLATARRRARPPAAAAGVHADGRWRVGYRAALLYSCCVFGLITASSVGSLSCSVQSVTTLFTVKLNFVQVAAETGLFGLVNMMWVLHAVYFLSGCRRYGVVLLRVEHCLGRLAVLPGYRRTLYVQTPCRETPPVDNRAAERHCRSDAVHCVYLLSVYCIL